MNNDRGSKTARVTLGSGLGTHCRHVFCCLLCDGPRLPSRHSATNGSTRFLDAARRARISCPYWRDVFDSPFRSRAFPLLRLASRGPAHRTSQIQPSQVEAKTQVSGVSVWVLAPEP